MAESNILLSLRRKLVQFEAADNTDKVKATKARIKELEKAAQQSADLADSSIADLRELAAQAGIEGRSGMNKAELIAALEDLEEE